MFVALTAHPRSRVQRASEHCSERLLILFQLYSRSVTWRGNHTRSPAAEPLGDRALWLKQRRADCCKNSIQRLGSSGSAYFLTRTLCSRKCAPFACADVGKQSAQTHVQYVHMHVYAAFCQAFVCRAVPLLSIIPFSDTAGESCQNNCLSPRCVSEVCAEQRG